MHLYQVLAQKVNKWRETGYLHEDYPVISEVLEWAANPDGGGFQLRPPQVRALETYWYLRLVKNTPHIVDLYKRLFLRTSELLDGLGLIHDDMRDIALDIGMDRLLDQIRGDDEFVKKYRLQALRETLTLDYPSYILALAMGAGKTILIGAIIASEFGMSLEYPEGDFVQNALVFAPGKTIIESLRELAETQYDRLLPPRLYKDFAASVKLTFTRDGEKDIPVIPRSYFNVIVTNTEKIRITSEKILKGSLGPLFSKLQEDEARHEVANARLRTIASLPHLGVFSDEAHHTYGQPMDTRLKRVRQTVDYLADQTNVICVVNTTGTPYFKRQPLRDVVIWYGLSEGIRDNILKEVSGSIQAFDFEGNVQAYLEYIIEDFFKDYGDVSLPDGTPAKLAIFFPQTDDVAELRPVIEATLARLGLSTTLLLEHHTANENKEDFDRFKTRRSPHRIALLVNRGVEGWNVPTLYACALARKLKTSANFVLQAASRCLRQVPGNMHKARIYLSIENQSILDRQLQETYGETIAELNQSATRRRTEKIVLRKINLPPLVIKQLVRSVVRKDVEQGELKLHTPDVEAEKRKKYTFTLAEQQASYSVLQQHEDAESIESRINTVDLYSAAIELAAIYRVDFWQIYEQLQRISNREKELPILYLGALAAQIEEQTRDYEVLEEVRERALCLIKSDGFAKEEDENGVEVFTAEISYLPERERLLARWSEFADHQRDFGFHYDPYNFDSNPEKSFFEQLLGHVNQQPENVEDIYFTGALHDPAKTDFYVEYKGTDGKWHRYSPDFVIRCKDGKCLIVEIKAENERDDAIEGENGLKALAVRKWGDLNPDLLQYEMIFTPSDVIPYDRIETTRQFLEDC